VNGYGKLIPIPTHHLIRVSRAVLRGGSQAKTAGVDQPLSESVTSANCRRMLAGEASLKEVANHLGRASSWRQGGLEVPVENLL